MLYSQYSFAQFVCFCSRSLMRGTWIEILDGLDELLHVGVVPSCGERGLKCRAPFLVDVHVSVVPSCGERGLKW